MIHKFQFHFIELVIMNYIIFFLLPYSAFCYIAAVVEYSPLHDTSWTPYMILLKNLHQYELIIAKAADSEVDIIVFPEYGLTTLHLPESRKEAELYLQEIPDPLLQEVSCNKPSASWLINKLSCIAKKHKMYVSVNLGEKLSCSLESTLCPRDGRHHYNTNIVFSRRGELIARYRKSHLYNEPMFESLLNPEFVSFTTDFGVTFGIIVCFDIMFHDPLLTVISKLNISTVIF